MREGGGGGVFAGYYGTWLHTFLIMTHFGSPTRNPLDVMISSYMGPWERPEERLERLDSEKVGDLW